MAAALVPRELMSWSLIAVALGALEGGLLGVIVKNQFSEAAAPGLVNLAVAIVVGAPSFANLMSFFFASLAMGRDKVMLISRLMLLMGLCLFIMSIPGTSGPGLALFVVMTFVARSAWSGILTIRAAVWRVNYERRWRGHVTARIVQIASLVIAAFSAVVGLMLDWQGEAWRLLFPVAGACAVAGFFVYQRSRVRRHRHLLRREKTEKSLRGSQFSARSMIGILRSNSDFRQYMLGMMVFGSGNLMIIAMLVLLMNEHFGMVRLHQVMITSSVPLLVLCFSIRRWAKVLATRHIFTYRAIHSWNFVACFVCFALAAILELSALLWLGSILLGSAYAGGHLGWNLGHNDFTDDTNSSLYMAIHVGFTGARGLVMPIVGVMFFQYMETVAPGGGAYAMLLPLSLSILGSCWFVYLHRRRVVNG
ncbi:MAG: MFS transporter [Xanthomonadales bacterium]|nr:MFS transporter [Xanthomonadales bacterium]